MDDPEAQGIFAFAVNRVSTDADRKITLIYEIEKRRTDGSVLQTDSRPLKKFSPGGVEFLSCDTGRDVGGPENKLLFSIHPLCSTSRLVPEGTTCSNLPANAQWPGGYRYPRPALVSDIDVNPPRFDTSPSLTPDCKLHCKYDEETPVCLTIQLPQPGALVSMVMEQDWAEALRNFHKELLDETNFPISKERWKQLFDVDPAEFGRGADITLRGNELEQDGNETVLPYVIDDGRQTLKLKISVLRQIAGRRIVHPDKMIEWLPHSNSTGRMAFDDAAINSIYGGYIVQGIISDKQLAFGNGTKCVSIKY
ncbi:MAG: hypothetical protein ACR65X_10185 [Methylocystis sp.]